MSDVAAPATDTSVRKRKAFIPLECNPEVMTGLVRRLGLSPTLAFHDVYSISDPDLLAFVPRPVHALLLVFPVTEIYERSRIEEDSKIEDYAGKGPEEEVVWFKQTIKNACGMMGVLHAALNGEAQDHILPDTSLQKLLREAIPLDPRARADLIETTESLQTAHQAAAVEGSSAVPNAEDDVDLHYICFVKSKVNDHLYQLDGSRKGPLDRGPLGPEDDVFSPKALEAIQEFIDRERGDNVNFGLVALAPSMD